MILGRSVAVVLLVARLVLRLSAVNHARVAHKRQRVLPVPVGDSKSAFELPFKASITF